MAELKQLLVNEIGGEFVVKCYQRGYRWDPSDVERLLTDISNCPPEFDSYDLQPIVVKRDSDRWELIDGQQRLTTIYLIYLFMQRNGLQQGGPLYSISYETRSKSEEYLQSLDEVRSIENIEFHHIYNAYKSIGQWFAKPETERQDTAEKLVRLFREKVRVIWYEAPSEQEPTELFIRLNVGRIPLTDAELFKALLLSTGDRREEHAAQWDVIERDLGRSDVWAFISKDRPEEHPTRISLLLDIVAKVARGGNIRQYETFNILRTCPTSVWQEVLDLHALIMGWFEDHEHYHKIGYLVAQGSELRDVVALAHNKRKSELTTALDAKIKEELKLSEDKIEALTYDDARLCLRLLLLMNVETVRKSNDTSQRFPFQRHHGEEWSLEHIHAQNAEGLIGDAPQRAWLKAYRDALNDLPHDRTARDKICREIDSMLSELPIKAEEFQKRAHKMEASFADPADHGKDWLHSVSNLALLGRTNNSSLGNSAFAVKRRRVLELDKEGKYIPSCTRNAFLKYYSTASEHQAYFWSRSDRDSYLKEMISIVKRYLRASP